MISCLITYSQEYGTVTDPRDGKVYKTVKIGNQWIMAENLAFRPEKGEYWADTVFFNKALFEGTDASFGYVVLDSAFIKKHGYLYDLETAIIASIPGWHVPTNVEWKALCKNIGGNAKKLYTAIIDGGNTGFNAVLSGMGGIVNGNQKSRPLKDSNFAGFWSSTKVPVNNGICLSLTEPTKINAGTARMGMIGKSTGLSVRLFKDN
jgi:uncharacterized protein (TIGR02145 family)